MRPTTGTPLGGRYRLDRLIAVGGMGEVWVAHDLSLRRDVAVKVLREEFAGDAGFLERFRTEARNAASLSHPNIAATYDYGEQHGSSYLVMELVAGEPLSDLLEREPVLPEQRLLPILAQTARALHAAHLAGVVHRDVKPGNILLGPGGRVKITDFGVSTTPDQAPMTATGMVMGTAQYLSPEQAVGRPATASSDLYSLGIVAYEALAGRRPFTGPTAVDIAVAHVNDRVPPLPATVSAPVSALVGRLLAKDPADRPPSAGALARALDAMVGHTPPDGVPIDEPASGPPSTRPTHRPRAAPPAGAPAVAAPSPAPVAAPPAPAPPAGASPAAGGRPGAPPSYPPRRRLPDPRAADRPAPPPGAAEGTDAPRAASTAQPGRTTTAVADRRPGGPGVRHPLGAERVPTRTSTTTGRRLGRLGRWSWPLVALVALLLALLVGALADSVGGAQGGDAAASPAPCPARTEPIHVRGGGQDVGPGRAPARGSARAPARQPGHAPGRGAVGTSDDGMIRACAPSGHPGGAVTTTAKDA